MTTSPHEIFTDWHARLLADPACAMRVGNVRIELSGEQGGVWVVRGGESPSLEGPMASSHAVEAPCTVRMTAADFCAIHAGTLNPQAAFLMGRIAVEGALDEALTLAALMKPEP